MDATTTADRPADGRRHGLVGTGHWARTAHAPALAGRPGGRFVGVWGRDARKASTLAEPYDAAVFDHPEELFAAVDVVSFAVPPHVQAPLAVEAARAGCDLVLEKPIALDVALADDLAEAAAAVASVVFFTSRFLPEVADWIAGLRGAGSVVGGHATWFGSIFHDDSPYASSVWRQEEGALWDVGPHALSILIPLLGPVTEVAATAGPSDTVHLVLRHEGGASSTAALSLTVPRAAARTHAEVYGERGWSTMPVSDRDVVAAMTRALDELDEAAASGREHPCGAAFGRDVVHVLAAAQADLRR